MMTKGLNVEENSTAVARMFISSMDGNLTILNLKQEDAGFYTCSFTGSNAQNIQLNVIIGMFEWSVYRYRFEIIAMIGDKRLIDVAILVRR